MEHIVLSGNCFYHNLMSQSNKQTCLETVFMKILVNNIKKPRQSASCRLTSDTGQSIVCREMPFNVLNHLGVDHECDRRTDRQNRC